MANQKKLYRSNTDRVIGGVCGGLGKYFDIDPIVFRILFVVLAFAGGSAVLIYIILMVVIPEEPKGNIKDQSDGVDRIKSAAQDIKDGASRVADKIRDNKHWFEDVGTWIGIIIVGIGVSLLARLFIPITISGNIIGSIALIIVGLLILAKSIK